MIEIDLNDTVSVELTEWGAAYLNATNIFKEITTTQKYHYKTDYKAEGGNLAASKIRNLECPNYEICLIDYGCGKFNRKIHIMEQYP